MSEGEVAVVVDGHPQWRFHPHAVKEEERQIITPRRARTPPVPIGAELVDVAGGEAFGVVISMVQVQFERYVIEFEIVPDDEEEELSAAEKVPAEPAEEPAEQPEEDDRGEQVDFGILGLSSRVENALQSNDIESIGGLREIAAEGNLGALEGIGPASIEEIKAALGLAEENRDE